MRTSAPRARWKLVRDQLLAGPLSDLPRLLENHRVPGIQVAVGFRGRIILSLAAGVADRLHFVPVTVDTVFKAASIAKAVTALCVLRLVDQGVLALDAPFEHFADWRLPQDRRHTHDPRQITIRRLLSHTSGLDAAKFPQIPVAATAPSARDILDGAFGPDLTPHIRTAPGSTLHYAGSNFEVLRLLIESVCGEPLSIVSQREVFSPLGLGHSSLGQPIVPTDFARAHDSRGVTLPDLYYPAIGSSGLYTTASDLARLWLAIGGAPICNGRPLLSPSLHAQMIAPHATMPSGYAFGLGIAMARWGDRTLFKHAGIARGLFSMAEGTPGGCVIVMTNSDNGKPLVMPLVEAVTGCLVTALGRARPDRQPVD